MIAKSQPPDERQKKPVKPPRQRRRGSQPKQEPKPAAPPSIIEALEFRRLFDAAIWGAAFGPGREVSPATFSPEAAMVVSARIAHDPELGTALTSAAHR